MPFKPMLAGTIYDINALKYPVLVSPKLDGVRATVQGGRLLSRTLKPIPNRNVQARFAGLPEGLDGELIVGYPTSFDTYRQTVSVVMSDDKPDNCVCFHVFDRYGKGNFQERLGDVFASATHRYVVPVEHVFIKSAEELETMETAWLAEGYEGVMVRSIAGAYKEGRSTVSEGILLKLKRFVDSEAEVLGAYEQEHNDNPSFTNELGRTARSSAKDGMVKTGLLGGLDVRDLTTGIEFSIGSGFTAGTRRLLWAERETLPGRIVKYKYFPVGGKDKPRHPIWLGWRDRRDM
jgi:DNA ligase 1